MLAEHDMANDVMGPVDIELMPAESEDSRTLIVASRNGSPLQKIAFTHEGIKKLISELIGIL